MSLFGSIVRTAVNTVMVPVAVARDVVDFVAINKNSGLDHTVEALETLKKEAE